MQDDYPLIGITSGFDYQTEKLYLKRGYYEGVMKAGGLAVTIPPTEARERLDRYSTLCDGFLLSGGPDLDAIYYGEENLTCNDEISPFRDGLELYLVKKAFELNKPVFGICRGIQVLNVALGGTLYQDIHMQLQHQKLLQHAQKAPQWYPTHEIAIEKDSKVWHSFGQERIRVNSFHHQAVKEVAPNFVITAKTHDGIIEAIEHSAHPFAVGVQWHPEIMWERKEIYLNLFKQFVQACKLSMNY